jgi:Mn-containing catalase
MGAMGEHRGLYTFSDKDYQRYRPDLGRHIRQMAGKLEAFAGLRTQWCYSDLPDLPEEFALASLRKICYRLQNGWKRQAGLASAEHMSSGHLIIQDHRLLFFT